MLSFLLSLECFFELCREEEERQGEGDRGGSTNTSISCTLVSEYVSSALFPFLSLTCLFLVTEECSLLRLRVSSSIESTFAVSNSSEELSVISPSLRYFSTSHVSRLWPCMDFSLQTLSSPLDDELLSLLTELESSSFGSLIQT